MAKILEEGCVSVCSHCSTKFSFVPHEVKVTSKNIPPGYSPEEEGYKKSLFNVECPKCHESVDVESSLGAEGKRAAESRSRTALMREAHDL